MTTGTDLVVPAFIRGETIADDLTSFGGRTGGGGFLAPDPQTLIAKLPLRNGGELAELHEMPFGEIVDYLAELGGKLDLASNPHLQEALEHSEGWSDMTPPLIRTSFEQLPSIFTAESVREIADSTIGIPYLEGWVEREMSDGRTAAIRAMGARSVHIIAGNSPLIAALSIVRNAICRSDAIVKTPSNDPLTALAIARTMAEMAPGHPITRHLSVAYWKGGDESVEEAIYHPGKIEKIVAWGGFASVTHVLRYVQPGLELITLDPKRSATIIGPEAFESPEATREAALRVATDVGAINQLGCVNARVVYVATGLDQAGLERANAFGEAVYEQIQGLHEALSTPAKRFDPELKASVESLRSAPDFYRVVGGTHGEGAVVVSQLDEPVDFHRSLNCRVANVVPIEKPADAVKAIDNYSQTIGIYPESLKEELRDILPLYGAQRLVSLGYAAHPSMALPQDAIEPVRRMVKWIVDESCDPAKVEPLWES
jgi:hypothetical protein